MSHVSIIGTGRYLPEHIMTNDDLSNLVDTSDEWIRTRTGISERRISVNMNTSDLAYEAGLIALDNSGLKPEELDKLVDYIVELFGSQFTRDDVYDGLSSRDLLSTITNCINEVVGGMTESTGGDEKND